MPRGRTSSPYTLGQRKRLAASMFTKGYSAAEVAERLGIHPGTAAQYRQEFEDSLGDAAAANPGLLKDVLRNTVQALNELDQVRKHAWEEYEAAQHDVTAVCPVCEHHFVAERASSTVTRNQLLKTITAAQDQRAKLLGLFGVKADFLHHVNAIRLVQEKLLNFMRQELCEEDKQKLEALLTGPELGPHVGVSQAMPAIPAEITAGE